MPVQRIDISGSLIGSPQQPMQTSYTPTMSRPQTQQMPRQQYGPQEPSFLQNVGRTAGDFGKGVASSVGGTVLGLGGMFGRAIMPESMEQKFGITKESEDELRQMLKDWRGDSFAAKAGEFVGEAGQFFAPTGLVGGAAKGVQLLRGAKAVQQAPKIKKALDVTSKALGAAQKTKTGRFATGGLVTAGQEKVITGETSPVTALTGGLFDIKKRKAADISTKNYKKAQEYLMKVIRPSRGAKGQLKFDADPTGEILRQNIKGENLEELGTNTVNKLKAIGKEIGSMYKQDKNNYSIAPVRNVLKTIKKEYIEQGNKAQAAGLDDLLEGIYAQIGKTPQDKLSATKVWQIIKRQNSAINYTEEAVEKGKNKARYKIVKKLQEQLMKNNPTLKPKNKAYQNLTEANVAIKNRDVVEARNSGIGLTQALIGIGTAGLAGDPSSLLGVIQGLGVGFTAAQLTKKLQSPANRQRMARFYYNLSKKKQAEFLSKLDSAKRKAVLNAISNVSRD